MGKILENYGELVFDQAEMKKRLTPENFKKYTDTVKYGTPLDESIADDIAHALKDWALEHGATHFTHWFQPQRDGTAEKHDAFLSYDSRGNIIEKFSTNQLIQSEPDASSFPSGGIRSTFEARGYTAWDPASPAFLRECEFGRSLVIPSIYLSWTGEALDMKTPLLRSTKALNHYAIELQRFLGNKKAKRVSVYTGFEQEYFLIPEELYHSRPDLQICGRTLFGAQPSKGQVMSDHYFGSIPNQVLDFMNDLETELYRHGIPVKTKHNEVAPNQFELAPLYETVNLSIDHNLQTMDIMKRIAQHHGFCVLHHEKPFAGLNGSGKHMNWSLGDNTDANYLHPSDSPENNIIFLMTLGALLLGVKDFSGILRGAIADVGNEHRLGSHEAPPAILSVYLGSYLTEILDHIEGIKKLSSKEMQYINHGLEVMPTVVKDASDRNRTSPIAYTGDKFEFRSVGSNANGARAASGMNVICAYGFKEILDRVQEKKGNAKERCILVLKDILKETKSVRFEGDNYSDNWKKEAKKRGLYIQDHTSDSLAFFSTPDCVALYESMNVLSKRELDSRTEITLDNYANLKAIEFKVGVTMIRTAILPAITKQLSQLGDAYMACQAADIESPSLKQEIKLMEGLYKTIHDQTDTFQKELKKIEALEDTYKRASALDKKATPLFQSIRSCVDEAEKEIDMDIWPFPSYDELLSVK